jgi:hypothetical protein
VSYFVNFQQSIRRAIFNEEDHPFRIKTEIIWRGETPEISLKIEHKSSKWKIPQAQLVTVDGKRCFVIRTECFSFS